MSLNQAWVDFSLCARVHKSCWKRYKTHFWRESNLVVLPYFKERFACTLILRFCAFFSGNWVSVISHINSLSTKQWHKSFHILMPFLFGKFSIMFLSNGRSSMPLWSYYFLCVLFCFCLILFAIYFLYLFSFIHVQNIFVNISLPKRCFHS